MGDTIAATPGAGVLIATDLISGEHHALSKVEWGADGGATQVSDQAGARLPVAAREGLNASSVICGQVSVATSEAALPGVSARRFRLRALFSNVGTVYIGDGTVSSSVGFPIEPGDWLDGIEVDQLSRIHAVAVNNGDKLAYFGEV